MTHPAQSKRGVVMEGYRAFVHDDGEYLSIGFEDTNDTLLKMPEGWRDREQVVAWVEAVNRARGAVSRAEVLRGALLAIGSGHPDPAALAQRTLRDEYADAGGR